MDEADKLDLRMALATLRRRRLVIVLCLVATTGVALAYSLAQTKQYSASSSLLFRDPGFDQRLFGSAVFETTDPTREAATNLELVSLDAVADRTAEELDDGLTREAVADKVQVEAAGGSNLVSVTATDPDPRFAAKLANSFAQNYVEFRREADRDKIREASHLVQQDYERLSPSEQQGRGGRSLQNQISALRTIEALQTGNAELVQPANAPISPSSPRTVRNTILGAFLGLLLGVGLSLLLDRIDRRLKNIDDLEKTFSLPVLAGIPDSKALTIPESRATALSTADAEPFGMLRMRLRYFNVEHDICSVLVTSPSAQDGKSTVALNLVRSAAASGSRAVLVEADFHHPAVAQHPDVGPLPGLAELLSGQAPLERVIQKVAINSRSDGDHVDRHFDVIVAGATPPNAGQILESAAMAQLIQDLSHSHDTVVIDTPPAAIIADAIPLMRMVDGVIVVGRVAKTTRDDAAHLRDQLRALDAPVLGVVANRVRGARAYYGYGNARTKSVLGLRIGRGRS